MGTDEPPLGQPPAPEEQAACFEESLARLEAIVHDLEEGQIGVSESLDRYEEGVKLLRQCFSLLEKAERRIELLTGVDAAGNPVTAPFDDPPAESLEEKAQARSRRRSAATPARKPPDKPPPGEIDSPGKLF